MTDPAAPNGALKNHLLAALPAKEYLQIQPKLERVDFKLGDVLYEADEKMDHVYFPTTAIISLLSIMENGATAEIGVTGNDGVVGIALYMGSETTPSRAIVQSAGDEALRIEAAERN